MPAYMAQWASLEWACAEGCTRYDWWGGPTADDISDPLFGVARFKAGFGAVLERRLGPWDAGVRPAALSLYRGLTGVRRRALTWRAR
jgi:lipid II:glycine glycyltransferase (peptidoglycan interpeptide bridge formation enzyme)